MCDATERSAVLHFSAIVLEEYEDPGNSAKENLAAMNDDTPSRAAPPLEIKMEAKIKVEKRNPAFYCICGYMHAKRI